jgi:hypothetical protein
MMHWSQNPELDNFEDDYSMIDEDESIPRWHSSQEDSCSEAGSEFTGSLDETEVPAEEDTSGLASDRTVRLADNELLPEQDSSLMTGHLLNGWQTPTVFRKPAPSHVANFEHADSKGLVPMLDCFAKEFKEGREARLSDPDCSLDPEADHFVRISEFQNLQSQVNNNSLSLKHLKENADDSRIAELESALRSHAKCIAKNASKGDITSLRHLLESLSVELQQEKRRSDANIRALDELERQINIMNEAMSDRVSEIEGTVITLEHLQQCIEDKREEQSKHFLTINQKMETLVGLVREIKNMNDAQTDRLSNIEWTNCILDGELQSLHKSLYQKVEAIYARLDHDKKIENEKEAALRNSIEKQFSECFQSQKVDTKLYIQSLVECKQWTLETSYGERLNRLEKAMAQLQNEPRETNMESIHGRQITDLINRLAACEKSIEQLKNYQLEAIRCFKPAIEEQESLTQQIKEIKLWQETVENGWIPETASKLGSIADEVREILKSGNEQIRNDLNPYTAAIQNSIAQLALEQENCSNLVTKCAEGQRQFSQKVEKSIKHVLQIAENSREYCGAIIGAMDSEREEQFQERMTQLKKEVRAECDQAKEQYKAVLTVCHDAVKQMSATCDVISGRMGNR